jgi:hypothetical protein
MGDIIAIVILILLVTGSVLLKKTNPSKKIIIALIISLLLAVISLSAKWVDVTTIDDTNNVSGNLLSNNWWKSENALLPTLNILAFLFIFITTIMTVLHSSSSKKIVTGLLVLAFLCTLISILVFVTDSYYVQLTTDNEEVVHGPGLSLSILNVIVLLALVIYIRGTK